MYDRIIVDVDRWIVLPDLHHGFGFICPSAGESERTTRSLVGQRHFGVTWRDYQRLEKNAMPVTTGVRRVAILVVLLALHVDVTLRQLRADQSLAAPTGDGTVIKAVIDTAAGDNLLVPDAWRPWQKGFQRRRRSVRV